MRPPQPEGLEPQDALRHQRRGGLGVKSADRIVRQHPRKAALLPAGAVQGEERLEQRGAAFGSRGLAAQRALPLSAPAVVAEVLPHAFGQSAVQVGSRARQLQHRTGRQLRPFFGEIRRFSGKQG